MASYDKTTKDRSEADAFAANITQQPNGVLDSDQYSSLRPGFWAVWVGEYPTQETAAAASKRLASEFPGAYPREVAS